MFKTGAVQIGFSPLICIEAVHICTPHGFRGTSTSFFKLWGLGRDIGSVSEDTISSLGPPCPPDSQQYTEL